MELLFEIDGAGIKKLQHLKKNIFVIYSPRTITIDTASSIKIDTNIILHLTKKKKAFIPSKFWGQEIYEITKRKSRLWIEILNTSYNANFNIKNKTPLGFLVAEPENLKSKYGKKKKTKKVKGILQNWEQIWKSFWEKKKTPKGRPLE